MNKKNKRFALVAVLLAAVTAVAGYFVVGPGADGGYGKDYNVTDTDTGYRGGY